MQIEHLYIILYLCSDVQWDRYDKYDKFDKYDEYDRYD